MTNRERMQAVLDGRTPFDRLPAVEWATWWDKTIAHWRGQGLPPECVEPRRCFEYFGLDDLVQIWVDPRSSECPAPVTHGQGIVHTEQEYERVRRTIHQKATMDAFIDRFRQHREAHGRGDFALWYTLEGFFWFPRSLLGIEQHLYAFYDQPELMHRINRDLAESSLRFLERLYEVDTPEFMTFAEDMSYNHGPMLSKDCFDEFLLPYYRQLIPFIHSHGTRVFIDTDGDVEPLIPWFREAGIEGVLPLERQAGVDVCRIREQYPDFLMIGGFDKTVMHLGEGAMRVEFERIFPAMRAGGYLPSVDHQTPPDVTVEQYRVYVSLLKEYARKAVKNADPA